MYHDVVLAVVGGDCEKNLSRDKDPSMAPTQLTIAHQMAGAKAGF